MMMVYTVKLWVESGSHMPGPRYRAAVKTICEVLQWMGCYRDVCVNDQVSMKLMNSVEWKSLYLLRFVTY